MTNKQVAESTLTNVGGPTNISSVVHCATRLRFKLKDESKADTNALNHLVGVIYFYPLFRNYCGCRCLKRVTEFNCFSRFP